MVFPGSSHSRFAHSIGVMEVARRMLTQLKTTGFLRLSAEQEAFILAAALLHDLGHGPFSHSFEKITGDRHELRTLEIIQDPTTEVGKVLRNFHRSFPAQLGMFFDSEWEVPSTTRRNASTIIPPYLTELVSSQLDADRFDYLLRDNLCTGSEYGRFDLEWIIRNLKVDGRRRRIYLGLKALFAAETYVFARYHMYRTVYYHKSSRAAEVMLRLIFTKLKRDSRASKNVLKIAPPVFKRMFTGKLSLEDYLALDDGAVIELFRTAASSSDTNLASLAKGLLDRRLFKCIDVTGFPVGHIAQFRSAADALVRQKRLDPEYAFNEDTVGDTPYKPYDPDIEGDQPLIWVEDETGKPTELSQRSLAIQELRKEYQLLRYFFPDELRPEINRLVKIFLRQ